jgi:hypothetical protein
MSKLIIADVDYIKSARQDVAGGFVLGFALDIKVAVGVLTDVKVNIFSTSPTSFGYSYGAAAAGAGAAAASINGVAFAGFIIGTNITV